MRQWRKIFFLFVLALTGWAGLSRAQTAGSETGGGAGGNGGIVGDVHIGLESLGGGPEVEGGGEVSGGTRAWYRQGHWVPVRVRLENHTGRRFAGYLAAEQVDLDGDKVRCVSRQIVVEPGLSAGENEGGDRDVWLYVWPRPDDDQQDQLLKTISVLDENRAPVATLRVPWDRAGRPITLEAREDRQSQRWIVVLGPKPLGWANYQGTKQAVATNQISWLTRAAMMPDSPLGLDGVDVVVWEAGQEGVRIGDLGEDIRLKALLEWVRAGGHLIITVGDHWAEVADSKSKLAEALPITLNGALQRADTRFLGQYLGTTDLGSPPPNIGDGAVVQATGKLHPGARALGPQTALSEGAPVAATGLYGAGTVTLVTVDLAAPAFDRMKPADWVALWQQTAGWRGVAGTAPNIMSADEYKILADKENNGIPSNPPSIELDSDVTQSVDLQKQTAVRLFLAVIFLGLYWLAAGPLGHWVLRRYHVTHWSWWIFGATVLGASFIAAVAVWGLRLGNYELRHRTYVMGRVGSSEVSLVGYYGVFAPIAGTLEVRLPPATGLAYLTPLCDPSIDSVQSFADPQHYDLDNTLDLPADSTATGALGSAQSAGPRGVPFRSTLKKLQARWVGDLAGQIEGHAIQTRVARPNGEFRTRVVPQGTLVNSTGYDLADVEIIFTVPERPDLHGLADTVFDLPTWASGKTLDLATLNPQPNSIQTILMDAGEQLGGSAGPGGVHPPGWSEADADIPSLSIRRAQDLLNTLLEARGGERVQNAGRVEFRRQLTRLADRSNALRVTKMLITARAGDWRETGADSPIPLTVNGRALRGKGEILFTWTNDVERLENPK